ncbi:MAG TPA: hypothetical protein VJQ57_14245 [Acidimicrobiia bacterium]|nr:hypothetical protein [Acidimicrobiia bacterium]
MAIVARLLSSEAVAGIGLTASVLIGFGLGGFVAGSLAPVNGRFHGSITSLVVAGIVVGVAGLGGSPTPLGSVLLLALIAIVTGGISGAIGGRRAKEPMSEDD